jgi:hypothetical protein
MTKSMLVALTDLKLERAWFVYPGRETYRIHERVEAIPLGELLKFLAKPLRPRQKS